MSTALRWNKEKAIESVKDICPETPHSLELPERTQPQFIRRLLVYRARSPETRAETFLSGLPLMMSTHFLDF